jgi:hypothetical protein
MTAEDWAEPVSREEAARRAGGRRAYNLVREIRVYLRRREIARRFDGWALTSHGVVARIARAFQVSLPTASRDRRWVLCAYYHLPRRFGPCTCGQPDFYRRWKPPRPGRRPDGPTPAQ